MKQIIPVILVFLHFNFYTPVSGLWFLNFIVLTWVYCYMGLRILHTPRSCIQYTLYTDQTLWIRVEGSADYQSKFGFTVPGLRFIVSSGFKYLQSVFSRSEIKPCPGEDVRRRKLKPYSTSGRKLCILLY